MRYSAGRSVRGEGGLAVALLLLAALGAWRAQAAGAPEPTLRLTVEPARVELWRDERAHVTIDAGRALDDLQLSASVGRIESVRETTPGRYEATWLAPEEAFPQVALLIAHGRSGGQVVYGWHPLPLWGLADAQVHATPLSSITVEVGGRSYGPVRTDARGRARVPLEVGPGEATATQGRTQLPLALPQGRQLHVALASELLAADVDQAVPVHVFAITPQGTPLEAPVVQLTVDRGALSAPRPIAPGVLEATWQLSPGAPGKARLRARLAGRGAPEALLEVSLRPGAAARLSLSADATEVPAGHPQVVFTARATDGAGTPVTAPLQLRSNLCALAPEEVSAGVWTARCSVPTRFAGAAALEALARVAGPAGQELVARSTVRLVPGEPHRLTVLPADAELTADGRSTLAVRVALEDRYGNPVPGVRPTLRLSPADAGELEELVAGAAAGEFVALLRPLLRREDRPVQLEARSGRFEAQAPLRLRGYQPWLSLAPRVSLLSNLRDVHAPWAGAELSLARPLGLDEVAAALEVGWSSFATSASAAAQLGVPVSGATRYVAVLGSAGWRRPLLERWVGWVSAAGGAARVSQQLRLGAQPESLQSAWVPAAALTLGLERPVWRGGPHVMARLVWFGDPRLDTLSGSLSALSLGVGYRLELL